MATHSLENEQYFTKTLEFESVVTTHENSADSDCLVKKVKYIPQCLKTSNFKLQLSSFCNIWENAAIQTTAVSDICSTTHISCCVFLQEPCIPVPQCWWQRFILVSWERGGGLKSKFYRGCSDITKSANSPPPPLT